MIDLVRVRTITDLNVCPTGINVGMITFIAGPDYKKQTSYRYNTNKQRWEFGGLTPANDKSMPEAGFLLVGEKEILLIPNLVYMGFSGSIGLAQG